MSVEQYVDISMLSETKFRPGREWRAIRRTHARTSYILFSCAIIARLNFVLITFRRARDDRTPGTAKR